MGAFHYFQGTIESEMNLNMGEILGEKCGITGVVGVPQAHKHALFAMGYLPHRGEQSAGISSNINGKIKFERELGRPQDVFPGGINKFDHLESRCAITQNRYATVSSGEDKSCIQPMDFESKYGNLSFAHNGNIPNSDSLRQKLLRERSIGEDAFKSGSDSETFAMYVVTSNQPSLEEAVMETAKIIPTAYSFLIMADKKIIGVRDRFGVRPLHYGSMGAKGHIIASEDYFFSNMHQSVYDVAEVQPGQMVVLEEGRRVKKETFAGSDLHFCSFELLYLSSAFTNSLGVYNAEYRKALGRRAYELNKDWIKKKKSVISPILNSGKYFALGFSEASGIPYEEGLVRLSNIFTADRSFMANSEIEQEEIAFIKHKPIPRILNGKNIFFCDDTIVRGTTSNNIMKRVRKDCTPESLHLFSSGAIVQGKCDYGVSIRGISELLIKKASSEEEIAKIIGSDSVHYLPIRDMLEVFSQVTGMRNCAACFGLRDPADKIRKLKLNF